MKGSTRPGRPGPRPAVIASLLLVAALSVCAAVGYLRCWINDHNPGGVLPRGEAARVAQLAEPIVAAPAVRPRRLILVVVDGLRADRAQHMRSLNELAGAGVDLRVDVGQPSQSRPVYSELASGCPQDRSGVRTNGFGGASPVDSLFERARDAGLRVVAVSGLNGWRDLFPSGFDRYLVASEDRFWEAAARALERDDAALVLLHPTEVDVQGHRHGAGSQYDAAVAHVDQALGRLLAEHVDPGRDAVWVLSDHGHRDQGGHGGDEPEVELVRAVGGGVGVARGARAGLPADRLAATWAVLMGLPFPWDAEGEPDWELLDGAALGSGGLAARREAWAQHVGRYLERLAAVGGIAFDPAEGFAGWRRGMQAWRRHGRAIRLGVAAAVLLLGLALLRVQRGQSVIRVALGGASFAAVYLLAAWLTHDVGSLSAAARETGYLLRLAGLAAIAFAGQHGVMYFLGVTDWGTSYLVGVWLAGASVVIVLADAGVPLAAPLPGAGLLFWPLFATFMTFSQASLGGISLAVRWGVERRGRRGGSHPDEASHMP